MATAPTAASASPLRIFCIGAGYVGGPTMAMIALKCKDIQVTVFDMNQARIDAWNDKDLAKLPVFEPGMDKVIAEVRGRNLHFTTDESGMADADIIFMSVNTPTKMYGAGKGRAADLRYIELCARQIARICTKKKHQIIVEKSTVPVRCSSTIEYILNVTKDPNVSFSVLSNPEFLAEGTAMKDLANPDRVLIGGKDDPVSKAAVAKLVSVYQQWVPRERILTTNQWSSELSKLVANAFLAQRVSSINSISAVCESTGADICEVAKAIGTDTRVGSKFLQCSIGFGGSCFQKDILNLVYISETLGLPEVANYWHQVIVINDWQRERFAHGIVRDMFGTVSGKRIAVLGFAFKKDTGDTRESSAIPVSHYLLEEQAVLAIYDPKVADEQVVRELTDYATTKSDGHVLGLLKEQKGKHLLHCKNAAEAAKGAHAVIVLTEWQEFAELDWEALFASMVKPAFVFDGRHILDHTKLRSIGFRVAGVGMPTQDLSTIMGFSH